MIVKHNVLSLGSESYYDPSTQHKPTRGFTGVLLVQLGTSSKPWQELVPSGVFRIGAIPTIGIPFKGYMGFMKFLYRR
jgi:hypothetical protein